MESYLNRTIWNLMLYSTILHMAQIYLFLPGLVQNSMDFAMDSDHRWSKFIVQADDRMYANITKVYIYIMWMNWGMYVLHYRRVERTGSLKYNMISSTTIRMVIFYGCTCIHLTGSSAMYQQNYRIDNDIKTDFWGPFLVCHQSINVACVPINKFKHENDIRCWNVDANGKTVRKSTLLWSRIICLLFYWQPKTSKLTQCTMYLCVCLQKIYASLNRIHV